MFGPGPSLDQTFVHGLMGLAVIGVLLGGSLALMDDLIFDWIPDRYRGPVWMLVLTGLATAALLYAIAFKRIHG